jgi:hypothetical protein
MHAHHDKLEAAAAAVTEWIANIRTINEKIAAAEAGFVESQKRRQENILAAALGDHDARARLDHVLEDDLRAERELGTLRSSLPIAEAALANAQRAQKSAEAEWRRSEVVRLARDRVEAAAAIDQAFAEFSAAWQRYSDLGRELFIVSDDNPNQIYLAEHLDGLLRLSAALPHQPFFDLRHRHSFAQIGGGAPLAVSEAAFWRLPPVEAVKAA